MSASPRPKLSIVIPTRNRGYLLRTALDSALALECDDLEVLVSNNDSGDDTEAVVKATTDPRIRYFRTDRTLAMPDHWEFILAHARGDYVRVLCDDDALLPRSFRDAEAVFEKHPELDAVIQRFSAYHHPSSPIGLEPNCLEVKPRRTDVREPDRDAQLRKIIAGNASVEVPTMLNGYVRRPALDQIRALGGRLFPPPAPDYGFAALFILGQLRWGVSESVGWLCGKSVSSIGAAQERGRNAVSRAFDQEFGADSPLATSPVPTMFTPTFVTAAVRSAYRAAGHECPFDLAAHFLEQARALTECEQVLGFTSERRVFNQALAQLPADQRTPVLEKLVREGYQDHTWTGWAANLGRRSLAWNRARIRRLIDSNSSLRAIKTRLNRVRHARAQVDRKMISGTGHAFSHIQEAAARYEQLEREHYPGPTA